jgi:hypothetical protein
MRSFMSSRDRLLCAINCEELDHLPLYLRACDRGHFVDEGRPWHDQFERVMQALELGLDDTVGFTPALPLNPSVKIWRRKRSPPGEERPIIIKEYDTPKGTLRQVVRQTVDWPHGDDIPIFSDFNVPPERSVEYLIKSETDLDALQCLFAEPTKGQEESLRAEAAKVEKFAERNQVLIECGGVGGSYGDLALGGDAAIWLCGVRGVLVEAYRKPDFVHRLLDIIHSWDMMRIRSVLDVCHVDVIGHRGWYEGTFFSPALYSRFIAPLIREEAEVVHGAGVKFGYIISRNLMPLLEGIKETGVDIIWGVDPVQDDVDLKRVKEVAGEGICLWGGVNSYVTLGQGDEVIRESVRDAIRFLAPGGGFILSAVDAVLGEVPSEGLKVMIEAWREYADYASSY